MKKLFLVLTLLFAFTCEDDRVEEPMSMKLWLNGEEVDVEAKGAEVDVEAESDRKYVAIRKKTFILVHAKQFAIPLVLKVTLMSLSVSYFKAY